MSCELSSWQRSKIKNKQAGFSLIEIAIVLVIVGVLASFTVTQLSKTLAKVRQAEAKTNLSEIYVVEQVFFHEFAGYVTEFGLLKVGFEGFHRYNVGFPAIVPPPPGYNGPPGDGIIDSYNYCLANAAICSTIASNGTLPSGAPTAAVTTTSNFTAGALAQIYQNGIDDVWTIDNTKNLVNTSPGIP